MRYFFVLLLFSVCVHHAAAQDLSYYLPASVSYDPSVPKPKDVIHHEVGEWHVTHDRLVNYMKAVASAAPARVKMETMGFTYEQRPQVLLIITSPKNHGRLEEIRKQHLLLSDPSRSAAVDIKDMPVVTWIGHSIHGNEQSGSNAALLTAYYLAAGQGREIESLLEEVVILFDPSFNPDGMQRFSTWVNQHRAKNLVSDPQSREFSEVWPGGRFNHYWFDLNRDWLPAVHVESRNRLEWYHKWKPNVLTDHHEQGSNATFFFQPGVPSRVNPLTPAKNQELTAMLAKYHGRYLDSIGSLYFTREGYDDFYYGKGSTYPDINGAIGILFEQASSRGHLQQTSNGLLSFPFTIRNQFVTALSTLAGAKALRKELLEWQREFYRSAVAEAATDPVKAYVFRNEADAGAMNEFQAMLQRHGIIVNRLGNDISVGGNRYKGGESFIVHLNQPQSKLIKTIFSRTHDYRDSLFYDITAWTMPLAFGITSDAVEMAQLKGASANVVYTGENEGLIIMKNRPAYGYLLRWNNLYSPAALYELLAKNLYAKVATRSFSLQSGNEKLAFNPGTILLAVQGQPLPPGELATLVNSIANKYRVDIQQVESGEVAGGIDLGSNLFIPLVKPAIALIAGAGVNATDAGEIWHLLDQRMNMPVSLLEPAAFNRGDLNRYNVILLCGGNYNELNKEKLRGWVQQGGTLVLTEEAVTWAAQNGISDVKFRKAVAAADSSRRAVYTSRDQVEGSQQVRGAIFGADVDLTHPLAFGYDKPLVSLFKANRVFMEKSRNPYATPFYYGRAPLQSGWISRENGEMVKQSAAVIVNTVGSGRVINISENPNFRAFWLGGTKLFMNAIFFGRIIDAASGRTED